MKRIIVMLNGVSGDSIKQFIHFKSPSPSNSHRPDDSDDDTDYVWLFIVCAGVAIYFILGLTGVIEFN